MSLLTRRSVALTIVALALLAAVLATHSVRAASGSSSNDDDDVAVEDLDDESDRGRRARLGGSTDDPFGARDFGARDEQPPQQQHDYTKSDPRKDRKEQRDKRRQAEQDEADERAARQQQQDKRQEKAKHQEPKSKPRSDGGGDAPPKVQQQDKSSSSKPTKASLSDQVTTVLRQLEDVQSDFTGTANQLARLSAQPPRHFNTSVNSAAGLHLLSRVLSSIAGDFVVDGDSLERGSSNLGTLRYEVYTLKQKVAKLDPAAAAAASASSASSSEPKISSPTEGSLGRDMKLLAVQRNLRKADELVKSLMATEAAQRTTHRRLLRAAKVTLPSTLRYVAAVVAAADDRLQEIRGVRSGEIDGAAPSGDAGIGRSERRAFQATVKSLKAAQASVSDFARLVDSQQRRNRGVTKSMEALFVFSQLLVRDGVSDDALDALVAADPNGGDGGDLGAFAAFVRSQHDIDDAAASHVAAEKNVKDKNKKKKSASTSSVHSPALAANISGISPSSPTYVIFGLGTAELLSLVAALVVPVQLANAVAAFALQWWPRGAGAKNNNKGAAAAAAADFAATSGAGRRLGGTARAAGPPGKPQQRAAGDAASSPLVVALATAAQFGLVCILLDVAFIAELLEDIPMSYSNSDITLPSVLYAALRLQASTAAQARLAVLLLIIAGAQGLRFARTFAEATRVNDARGEADE